MRIVVLLLALALTAAAVPLTIQTVRWLINQAKARRALIRYQRFVDDLHLLADEHAKLDNPFAVIVLDEIRIFTSYVPSKGNR
ncbi:hypothetical protein ACQP10_37835 (plasmid) [Streptosporangium sandarakinum]|uniref:hypothetical protein n=1 Tax=Streptosporangium sandarakinum TaxID=1260955 RepID=UPI003D902630